MSTYPNKLFLPGLNFLHLSLKQVVSSSGMKYYCIHVAKPCEIPMNWYAFSSARYQFKVVPSKKFVTDFFHWSWGMPLCWRKCSTSWTYIFKASDFRSPMFILGLIGMIVFLPLLWPYLHFLGQYLLVNFQSILRWGLIVAIFCNNQPSCHFFHGLLPFFFQCLMGEVVKEEVEPMLNFEQRASVGNH